MNLPINARIKIKTKDSNGNTMPFSNIDAIEKGIHYIFRLGNPGYQFYYGIWEPTPENAISQLEHTRRQCPDNRIEQQLQHIIISFTIVCRQMLQWSIWSHGVFQDALFINQFAHSIAMLLSKHYQVCFALHDDTSNLHVHFMVSTTSYYPDCPPLTYERLMKEYLPQIFTMAHQAQIQLEVVPDV